MSAQGIKDPPALRDEDKYEEWKNDINVWKLFTNLEKKKQGAAVYLSLQGRARECARDLTTQELGADDGVEKLITKLDALFEADKNTRSYRAFKEFYDYKRDENSNITEFLVHFEHLYSNLHNFDI